MDVEEIRLLQIEGQIHALARAWLHTAAALEAQGLLDPGVLERSLLSAHWKGADFEPHAHRTMQHLVDQLTDGRERRQRTGRYLSTGRDE